MLNFIMMIILLYVKTILHGLLFFKSIAMHMLVKRFIFFRKRFYDVFGKSHRILKILNST